MKKESAEKPTTGTGKRIGKTESPCVSITVYDPDREVSMFWEELKRHDSEFHIKSSRTARKIFLLGAKEYLYQIHCKLEEKQKRIENQGDLFENEETDKNRKTESDL